MRTIALMTLLILTPAVVAEPQEVPQALPVGRLMAPAGPPETRTIGPTGTLGAEVYRRRRKALMDKLKTGATLVVNEARFTGLRRSDSAPITGSHTKFETATQNVTIRLSVSDSFKTVLPNVGVYTVMV